jgi:hypothetical protein
LKTVNKEFEVRHNEVLHILSLLSKEAEKLREELVFLGGSAVQAVLSNPKRLSIDLDVYYSGDAGKLTEILVPAGYKNTQRKSRSPELFEFHTARKNDVIVKMDFLKIKVPEKYIFKKDIVLPEQGKFNACIGKPEYLMAAKLSALAVGTIGRKEQSGTLEIDVVKDVFDMNSLLDDFPGLGAKIKEAFLDITAQQNMLRGTSYTMQEVHESLERTLKGMVRSGKNAPVSQGALQSFMQHLYIGELTRSGLATMAMCTLYHASAIARNEDQAKGEEAVKKDGNREYLSICEKTLAEAGEDAIILHELKIFTPKALIYLYCSKFPQIT